MSLCKQLQLIVETSRDGTNKTGKRKRKEQTDVLQNEIIDQTPETPVTVPILPNEIVPPEERIFGQIYDDLVDDIEIQEVSESTPETEAVEIKQKISTGNIWKHKCIKQECSEVQTALKFNGKPLFRPLNKKE